MFFEKQLVETGGGDAADRVRSGCSLGCGRFSQAEQKFSMAVFDSNGKELLTEMAYSRREDANIRYLERIADQVEKGEIPIPAIAGKLYLKDGKMILHPLEIFQWGQEAGQTGSVCR